jgi:hypothetical protein
MPSRRASGLDAAPLYPRGLGPEKGERMNREFSPRFRSAAEALRFFFRISALLYGNTGNPHMWPMTRRELERQAGALGDYLRIGSCVGDLNEVQFFLLGEFYGPTCFASRTPGAGAGRGAFPDCAPTQRQAGTGRIATLSALRARLRQRRLVTAVPAQRRGQFARSPVTSHGPDHEKP